MNMSPLYVESSKRTPEIDFNNFTGELILSGQSIPENAYNIYNDLYNWTLEYCKKPVKKTNFRLYLEYFNTSSSIWIAKIVRALSSATIEDYSLILHLYFNIEEIEDLDSEDIKDMIHPIVDTKNLPNINLCIKICGVSNDTIIKETTVFF